MGDKNQEIERDLQKLAGFIGIYCQDKHKSKEELCAECQELLDYAIQRRKLCPLDPKPECKKCRIHCYKPQQRERIRQVMRHAGKRFYRLAKTRSRIPGPKA